MSDSPSGTALYRAAPLEKVPLGAQYDLVYLPLLAKSLLLPRGITQFLSASSEFMTLSAHGQRLGRALADGSATTKLGTHETLRRLLSWGCLVEYESVFAPSLASGGGAIPESSRIATVAIPTKDRPRSLAGAVRSYASNCRLYGHAPRILLVDDSREESQASACLDTASSLRRTLSIEIEYAGAYQRSNLVRELARSGVASPEVLTYGLANPTGQATQGLSTVGAARNAVLALTVGEAVLCVDDDTRCSPRQAPSRVRECSLKFAREMAAMEHWYFPAREAALSWGVPIDKDILAYHGQLLGSRVSSVVESFGEAGAIVVDNPCSHLFKALCAGEARVVATFNGLVGDSGMASPIAHLLPSNERSFSRLIESSDAFRSAMSSREVARVAEALTITHGGPWMMGFAGLDNTRLLPPFPPVGRNEDGVFGHILSSMAPSAFTAHLPVALPHVPEPREPYGIEDAPFVGTIRVNDIALACIRRLETTYDQQPSARLRHLGAQIADAAALPQREFADFVRRAVWAQVAELAVYLEALLASRHESAPPFWGEAVARCIAGLRETSLEPSLAESDSPNLRTARRLLGNYGKLLACWPDVIEATHDLRRAGAVFARRVR